MRHRTWVLGGLLAMALGTAGANSGMETTTGVKQDRPEYEHKHTRPADAGQNVRTDERRETPGRPAETGSTHPSPSGTKKESGQSGRASGSTPNVGDGTAAEAAGPGAGRSGSGSGNRLNSP
ncbi:hypothetical protein V8Z80_04895 [Orrella sp. JC864]|uniref:hypothetical protein n=1 Tax=Orrella sp. JC864 TaxID=3120298 RepID=UPI00300845B0